MKINQIWFELPLRNYTNQNKEAIKEKSRERYKNLSQEKKDKIKEYQKK